MISKAFIVKLRLPLLIFFSALVLFFSLRLTNLTRIPVFVDEAIYIRWSQVMRNEPSLRFLPLSDGKQPLFMWATMPALKFISDPLVAGRFVSIAAGLISLVGLSLLTFTLTASLPIASLAALVYAVLPFTVFFDRLALADSLLAAFGVWSLVFGVWLIKKPRLDIAMLLGFATGFGLLTKTPAVFFYLWQPIIFLFLFDFKSPNLPLRLLKLIAFWVIASLLSQGLYNILRLGPNFHLIGSRNSDYVFSFAEVLTHPTNPLIGNLKTSFFWLWYLLTPPLFPVGLFSLAGKFRKTAILLLLLSLFPLFSQGLIAKVYTSRYLLFAVLPLVVLISLGLWEVGERLRKHWLALIIFLLWPLILSAVLVNSPQKANLPYDMRSGYLEEWTAGWGQTEIAAYLVEKAKSGQKIVVGTDGYFGTLPDGLQIYTQSTSNITVIGGSPSITSLPVSLTDSLKDKSNTVYLVANASRVNLPPAELVRLELIAQYPKPARLDGTHESLLFFQLLR